MKILLLEDDTSLNRGITLKLQKEGYEVFSAAGVTEAELLFSREDPALVISDITMDDGNGLEFCRKLRERKPEIFIIFLTALDNEVDIVNGYDAGADDYITKPFSLMVLIAKVNSCMRRIGEGSFGEEVLVSGDIRVRCREMKVYQGTQEIPLSKMELRLLLFFLEHPKQILSREQILDGVWDIDGQFVDDNTVPVTISRLKRRLSEEGQQEYIKNVRGIGYLWMTEVLRK